MTSKTVLIVGATGQQGGAVINALQKDDTTWKVYGLTRDSSSAAAKRLAERGVMMIEGDMSKPDAIFAQIGEKVNTVFAMTQSGEQEESEGKAMVDGAVAHGIEHFIFTSVDRGGPVRSSQEPTFVPHFISKHNIEDYLIERAHASETQIRWTILRPVTFMDNFAGDIHAGFMCRIMEQMGSLRLQLISTEDIGRLAVIVLQDPELYDGKALTLAGDALNYESVCAIFRKEVGTVPELAPQQAIPRIGDKSNDTRTEDIAKMVQWFNQGGYDSNLDEIDRQWPKENPGLQNFATWLRTSRKYVK